LRRIRSEHPDAGILVVTETVFSMDSDVPFVPELQSICRRYGALLMVDVAHDLGAIGKTGRGYLEVQNFVGKPDILMGSFSKTFASNGGFVASDRTELKMALRYGCGPLTFTNSLSPVQAATVLACFDIIDSPEGVERRTRLMGNIRHMRDLLNKEGFQVLGEESAIVPVMLGANASSRRMTRWVLEHGGLVNLVEYPAVAKNKCRWHIQIMHDHTYDQIEEFVRLAAEARKSIEKRTLLVA
jgi:glycine C-acetyltransferase